MRNSYPIRVGVNAVIESENELLAVEFDDETGHHYTLPGGGVRRDENIRAALRREVREETTAAIETGDLSFVHEYSPPDHEAALGSIHKLTLFFDCGLVADSQPSLPTSPDPNQIGIDWLPLDSIEDQPLLPDLGSTWKTIAEDDHSPRFVEG